MLNLNKPEQAHVNLKEIELEIAKIPATSVNLKSVEESKKQQTANVATSAKSDEKTLKIQNKMVKLFIDPRRQSRNYNLIKRTAKIPKPERQSTMRDVRTAVLLEGMKPRMPQGFGLDDVSGTKNSSLVPYFTRLSKLRESVQLTSDQEESKKDLIKVPEDLPRIIE